MPLNRTQLAEAASALAARNIFIGTSSWKYEGWCGTLYDRARYEYRGEFAQTRFDRGCLAEYGQVLKTVCVDSGQK